MKRWGKLDGFNGKVSCLYNVYISCTCLHGHMLTHFQHICIFCLYIYAYLYPALLKGHMLQLPLPIATVTAMSSCTMCMLQHT